MMTTAERQTATLEKWGFACLCPRCNDPRELGTLMSGIKCSKCSRKRHQGLLFSTQPTNLSSTWMCESCDREVSSEEANSILATLIGDSANATSDIQVLEKRIFELSEKLSESHAWVVKAEYQLLTAYQNFGTDNLTRPGLDRFVQLCLHFVKVRGHPC